MDNEKFQELVLQQLAALTEGQRQFEERLAKLENTVTRIEYDHGKILGALLDGYKQNTEILDRHTVQLDRIESKIESHDIQISVLDKTKANKCKKRKIILKSVRPHCSTKAWWGQGEKSTFVFISTFVAFEKQRFNNNKGILHSSSLKFFSIIV
jgi:hypothetical protein